MRNRVANILQAVGGVAIVAAAATVGLGLALLVGGVVAVVAGVVMAWT